MKRGRRYRVSSLAFTKAAREALGLKGTKYPPDARGLAVDSFGRQVQLREVKYAGSMGMRLYTRCECGDWIPSGRLAQHLAAKVFKALKDSPSV